MKWASRDAIVRPESKAARQRLSRATLTVTIPTTCVGTTALGRHTSSLLSRSRVASSEGRATHAARAPPGSSQRNQDQLITRKLNRGQRWQSSDAGCPTSSAASRQQAKAADTFIAGTHAAQVLQHKQASLINAATLVRPVKTSRPRSSLKFGHFMRRSSPRHKPPISVRLGSGMPWRHNSNTTRSRRSS